MGEKIGYFLNDDGDSISVRIYGERVTDADILFGATDPVIIQMDGGGGAYVPVQYSTASISCITDSLELYELCTQDPKSVAVEILNETTGKVLFLGYVTPNSFNQSITGCNDIATIECVDWLGISKFVSYAHRDALLGTMTIAEAIKHIAGLLLDDAEILVSDYVQLSNQEIGNDAEVASSKETNDYTALVISEAYFYKSPESPEVVDGRINYDYSAMTCYEALSMIAESFRGTFVADGRTVLLNDVISQADGSRRVLNIDDMSEEPVGTVIDITEDSFRNNANSLSVLPYYDRYALERSAAVTRISCPLEGKYLKLNGKPILASSDTTARPYKYVYVQNHTSDLFFASRISTEASASSGIASIWSCKRSEIYEKQGLNPFWDDSWETYIRACCHPNVTSGWCSIALAADYVLPVVASEGLSLRISMEIAQSLDRDKLYPDVLENPLNGDVIAIRIKIGDMYYNAQSNEWGPNAVTNEVATTAGDESEWKTVFLIAEDSPEGILANTTRNGRVNCTIEFGNSSAVYYVKNLELQLISSWKNKKPMPEVTYRGASLPKSPYENVVVPIMFGLPKTKKTFSGVINGENYVEAFFWIDSAGEAYAFAYGRMRFVLNGVRYGWLERIERMAMFGDRKEYSLSLYDRNNSVSPYDSFICPQLWSGNKVVVAYIRNIKDNSIEIILD